MNCYKITFFPIIAIEDEEETVSLLWDYLGCLYKNGQILKDFLLVKSESTYIATVTLPEDNSLDNKYNNTYVLKYLDELEQVFSIQRELFGEDQNVQKSCTCEEPPAWYMLYSDWSAEESPVVCGRCGKSVPLYKLPYILNEEEHHGVLGWKEAYRNIDRLWMYCLSDRFTYRQMNNIQSQLSQDGREICRAFENTTGIPFYYYLFHYKKTPPVCPDCGGDWQLSDGKSFIDYKCEKCRLVADKV